MALRPISGAEIVIEGEFRFAAVAKDRPQISDSYHLRITVPDHFPERDPNDHGAGRKIPRTGSFHVNPDATLCLGSPLRLLLKLSSEPTLPGFASFCLVPYLYAISHKLKFGGQLPFSELKHGKIGELEDYMELLALQKSGAGVFSYQNVRYEEATCQQAAVSMRVRSAVRGVLVQ